jgi:DNA-binding response OmpR family regulator
VRVMVVDDDASIRALVRTALGTELEVVEAADGQAALALLQHGHVDLILLDVMMPGMDGFEVLARLRRAESSAQLPVVMLTARVGEADHVRAYKTGADGYVTKPFDVDGLLEEVYAVANRPPAERLQVRRDELARAELLRQIEQRFAS